MSRSRPGAVLQLSQRLRGTVPDRIADLFDDFVGNNEPVLAVEQLFDDLDDGGVRIPAELAERIVAVAHEYGVTRFTAEQVRALVR
jgi:hypothetical protein